MNRYDSLLLERLGKRYGTAVLLESLDNMDFSAVDSVSIDPVSVETREMSNHIAGAWAPGVTKKKKRRYRMKKKEHYRGLAMQTP